ncbi:YcgN family cysteine cluster protein [Maricaulis sp.]|uniref:YcgN family cysteine cluster protein n=1 Tax=Maricaulis sp. TaxID=1486257 RepID=UPI003A9074C6
MGQIQAIDMTQPFWKTKTLSQLSKPEWESLCDGCGKCCLIQLEDEDTGLRLHTDVTCRLFNADTCRCGDYPNRKQRVPDCVILTPKNVTELEWMPQTCAYRLIGEGKDLYDWHPLVSGDPMSVHEAGMSIRNQVVSEDEVDPEDWEDRIVEWPGEGDEEE